MGVELVRLQCKRLNAAAGPELLDALAKAWARGAMCVALDFSEVVYVDSLGISALIAGYRRRPTGARVVLCSLNDYVREVLEITQLVKVFDVYADGNAALKAAS